MKLKIRLIALLVVLVLSLSVLIGCDFSLDDILDHLPFGGEESKTPDTNDSTVELPSDSFDSPNDQPGDTPVEDKPVTPVDPPITPEDKPDDKPIVPEDKPIDPLPDFSEDPYVGVNKTEFYASYKPAVCYQDAKWRSEHFLMSGSIAAQDQAPTVSKYQPKQNGLLIRNTSAIFEDNGNTYVVLDAYGNEAFRVYRGGGYVVLEEVAAYVYAFGEIPANHVSKKSGSPSSSPWGIYLRLNHSMFSGNTEKYPYEPVLPDISGCGGDLEYYEMDVGTTGTDCDPSYTARAYNNGTIITRGAARIVYARYDRNDDHIIDPNERYLFYTYNHYNDFQEYLNYAGGWGEIFGNITGGGEISDKNNCNPTDYVETVRQDLSTKATVRMTTELVMLPPELMIFALDFKRTII